MKKNMRNHLQWLVIAVVAVAVGLTALSNKDFSLTSAQQKNATMILHFSDGSTRTFEGNTADKMTVLEALYTSTKSGGIRFVYTVNTDNNVEISAINNDLSAIGNKQWHFSLNGDSIRTEDINKIFVFPKDTIEATFE